MGNPLKASVSPLLIRIVIGVVISLWVASLVMDALVASYDPPDTIGLAFMAVLSAVLGAFAVGQKEERNAPPAERNPSPREEVEE